MVFEGRQRAPGEAILVRKVGCLLLDLVGWYGYKDRWKQIDNASPPLPAAHNMILIHLDTL